MLYIHRFVFNPFQENTYIIYNESNKCIIADPGCYTDEEQDQLVRFIDENKLEPVYLLNTHCHIDHILGNPFISEKWNLPLHIHREELPLLEAGPKIAEKYGFDCKPYTGAVLFINEKDTIALDNDEFIILFTPGHSPASLSFYNKENGLLISGDTLFSGSIGRTDLPGGDFNILETSIRTQLYTLPDDTKVYSGHGQGTSIGYEKKNNPFVREL